MNETVQSTFFENLKERLSNPFLFTYFWVFCTVNYQVILKLFFEPLKMSTKIDKYTSDLDLSSPLWLAIVFIVIITLINNLVEYYKQCCDRLLSWCLDKTKIKKMVALEEYENLKSKYSSLQSQWGLAVEKSTELSDRLTSLNAEHESKYNPLFEENQNLSNLLKNSESKFSNKTKELAEFEDEVIKLKEQLNSQDKQIEALMREQSIEKLSNQIEPTEEGDSYSIEHLKSYDFGKVSSLPITSDFLFKELRQEGLGLLKKVSESTNGRLNVSDVPLGKTLFEFGNSKFVLKNHKEITLLKSDLDNLIGLELLREPYNLDETGRLFEVTKKGYLLADKISPLL